MAHRNLESQQNRKFEIELNIRMRFDQNRSKIGTPLKWTAVLIVPLPVKIANHYLVHQLQLW